MICPVEVACHLGFLWVMCNLVEVGLESFFQTVLRLSHILFATAFAHDTVYQVVDVAANIVSAAMLSTRCVGFYFASFVQQPAISAIFTFV